MTDDELDQWIYLKVWQITRLVFMAMPGRPDPRINAVQGVVIAQMAEHFKVSEDRVYAALERLTSIHMLAKMRLTDELWEAMCEVALGRGLRMDPTKDGYYPLSILEQIAWAAQ